MDRFAGNIAVVTGAAAGIGAATAVRLAREGARVLLADRDAAAGERVAAEIHAAGGAASFHPVDLADEASIQRFGEEVAAAVPALHVLVNNAGIVRLTPVAETARADWDDQVNINLRAPALLAAALLPLLRAEGGAVVNVSSEGAFRPRAKQWVYDATKAGICALTRAMAAEFAPFGIRANAVAPGWTVTEMHFGGAPDPDRRRRELEERSFAGCLLDRLGRPDEIAAAIAFLASADASYVNATVLHVNGGLGFVV